MAEIQMNKHNVVRPDNQILFGYEKEWCTKTLQHGWTLKILC